MAAATKIYSIYKIFDEEKYYILRTTRPDYSNSSQTQENDAVKIEMESRDRLLPFIKRQHEHSDTEFIGEFYGLRLGEALYDEIGNKQVNLYYIKTEYGFPWIILGTAKSADQFLSELNEDEEALALKPVGQPKQITGWYLTDHIVN